MWVTPPSCDGWAEAVPASASVATTMAPTVSSTNSLLFILPLPSLWQVEAELVLHRTCMEQGHSSRLVRGDTYARRTLLLEANFLELRKRELRRIPLLRSRVNRRREGPRSVRPGPSPCC